MAGQVRTGKLFSAWSCVAIAAGKQEVVPAAHRRGRERPGQVRVIGWVIENGVRMPGRAQELPSKALMNRPFFWDWQITGFLVVVG